MKLYLIGHDYKYAVEQMLLTLYPEERPEYPEGSPEGDGVELKLSLGRSFATATCSIYEDGEVYYGEARFKLTDSLSELERDSKLQWLIKKAFYRAALDSGIERPVWGAVTGVRPGKIFTSLLEGRSEGAAVSKFMEDYDVSFERAQLCRFTSFMTKLVEVSLKPKDVCLYVGIPFCPTRCAYCSFVSQSVEKSMKLIPPFFEALLKEIDALALEVNRLGLRVISIYMGGGTPTTLSAEQLERLCTHIEEKIELGSLREYTVEAGRPDTITEEKLRVLRRHGVDRVSVNPQTMSDSVLELIGRRHTAQDIVDALDKVRSVGGMAVNMDLIAGLSGDSVEGFKDTLLRVMDLEPENITVHTLSLKKGSRIKLEGTAIPSAEEVGQMLDFAMEELIDRGYMPYYLYRQKFMSGGYENVGWTKLGHENIYNICIMEELCSILAVGGGGSTKLVSEGKGKNIRLFAPKYPAEYIAGIAKTCADKRLIREFYENRE